MVNRLATFVSAAVVSSAMATSASGQTADVGRAVVASDNLKLSMDTARTGAGPVTAKEFTVPYGGRIGVDLQLKSDGGHRGSAHVFSQIDFCTVKTKHATFDAFTCEVRVVEGDIVKVVVEGQLVPATSFATVRRVRVFYDVIDASGHGKVLMD